MIKRDELGKADFSDVAEPGVEPMAQIYPGEHLADYLKGAGVSQYRLATSIHVSPRRINEIVHGKRAITADTAVRLARFFGTSAMFWMNLQSAYELEKAMEAAGDLDDIKGVAA